MQTDLNRRVSPKQERGQKTVALILESAAQVLDEVGFENLSTNLVCKKAGLTPPALYRYFPNKYAILHELGLQLMDAQNDALRPLVEDIVAADDPADGIFKALSVQLLLTEEATGGRWITRSLHATPSLCEIRTQSHDFVARETADVVLARYPNNDPVVVQRTARLNIEIGYSLVEYLLDVPDADRHPTLVQTARVMAQNYLSNLNRST